MHRDNHHSVETELYNICLGDKEKIKTEIEDMTEEVYTKMVETDTMINLHFYPDTTVGFYRLFHYDIDMLLDIALAILEIK